MKKEKGPIRIPRDRARRARSLKAAAVAVVNRAYLELVAAGRSHDAALSELAAVAGITKNGVRNWLSNTNRPGKVAAEAIVLKYDRDLSARYGLLPLDPPAPAAGVQAQGELAGVRDPGPEVQDPPAGGPASTPPASRSFGLTPVRIGIREIAEKIAAYLGPLLVGRIVSLGVATEDLRAESRKRAVEIRSDIDEVRNILNVDYRDLRERISGVRIDVASVGVLATDIKNIISGRPTADLGRPLIGLSVQKKEDGFWLYLDDFARGKSGGIHIETGLPLLRELLARAAGPEPQSIDGRTVRIYAEEKEKPVAEIPLHGPAGPPPADGSDRSEPGLVEQTDELG